ncbi:MAG TPA: DUF1289 domain-containing protein [Rheinheimera sp.]|nr:DUF1289 domain-containing protein [Rheinheimera sp.]
MSDASPCIACCKLNSAKVCTGCYRHITEIVGWNRLSEPEQAQVRLLCLQRKPDVDAGPPGDIPITQAEWQAGKALLLKQKLSNQPQ